MVEVKIESGDVGISMTCARNRFSSIMLFLLIDSKLTAQLLQLKTYQQYLASYVWEPIVNNRYQMSTISSSLWASSFSTTYGSW